MRQASRFTGNVLLGRRRAVLSCYTVQARETPRSWGDGSFLIGASRLWAPL